MQVVSERWCGLASHTTTVVACVLSDEGSGQVRKQGRTVATMTTELMAVADWLSAWQGTQVARERTGICWRPVFTMLEERCTVTLVTAQHIKRVPRRTTDVTASAWLADVRRHGLLRASVIPPTPMRDRRAVTRARTSLVHARTAAVNRRHTVLETATLKVAAVATDVLGASGRAILAALWQGQADPAALADLATGKRRTTRPALRQALTGRGPPQPRLRLERILVPSAVLDEALAQVGGEIERHLQPVAELVALLQPIPGVGATAAATIMAEIGVDMTAFARATHLAAWAGGCPGTNERGGVTRTGTITPGNRWLTAVLGEAAWVLVRLRDHYLSAQ
jgi:transposase